MRPEIGGEIFENEGNLRMKKIRKYGDKVLREKCQEITGFDSHLKKIISDLQTTLSRSSGVGLAGPQIGVKKRVFVVIHPETKKFLTFINPEIEEETGKDITLEGCLSFPEIFFSIPRAEKVVVSARDEKGKKFTLETQGLLARCIRHETDHLNGILIIDYASPEEKKFWADKLKNLS